MPTESRQTILIVDDEPTNIAVLNAMLNKHYKVKAALNGNDALKIAQSDNKPDLILLDVIMEKPDGFDVCATLKSQPATQHIPIIFVTALTEVKNDRKGIELGAVDVFSKPYSAPIILKRLENHFELINLKQSTRTGNATLD